MSDNPGDERHLSHVAAGEVAMVDVSAKPATERQATARGFVGCDAETLALIASGAGAKGDVLAVARIAGVMAAKQTASLIPLCHPLPLTHVDVKCAVDVDRGGVEIEATARCVGPTGVEMEALTAVSVAALTVVDMVKSADRWMTIGDIGLVAKSGGRSGALQRPADRPLR